MTIQVGSFTGIQADPDPNDISSDKRQFPEWFNDTHLSELGEQTIAPYANIAERDAAGAPGQGQAAWCFTQDTGTLWAWWGGGWQLVYSANGGVFTGQTPVFYSLAPDLKTMSMHNGTSTLRWTQVGKLVTATYQFNWGSTTDLGNGAYAFRLPTPTKQWLAVNGMGAVYQSGAAGNAAHPNTMSITVAGIGGQNCVLHRTDTDERIGTLTGSTDGKTAVWKTGDWITFTVIYEAA